MHVPLPRVLALIVVCSLAVLQPAGAEPTLAADPERVIDLAQFTDADLLRVHGYTGFGQLGLPVAGGHDCDDDGNADVVMASMTARAFAGEIYLVFGDGTAAGTVDTSAAGAPGVLRILGAAPREVAGAEVWMDDVTGDDVGDLLIGRPNYSAEGRVGAGALTILVGGRWMAELAAAGQALDLAAPAESAVVFTLVGAAARDRLGIWMRTGDVDGDEVADIVVGADQMAGSGQNHAGAVWVLRGGPHVALDATIDLAGFATGALAGNLARLTAPSTGAAEFHFGATCQLADLDGNGRAEVLAAATLNRIGATTDPVSGFGAHATGGPARGRLFIFWDENLAGAWPAGLTIAADAATGAVTTISGGADSRYFGEELVGGDDYDGDDRPDLFVGDIVGDYSPGGNRSQSGSGHVFWDAASLRGASFRLDALPEGVEVTTIAGEAAGDLSSDTVVTGDFDDDGYADLAIASPHGSALGRERVGFVDVLHGMDGRWPDYIDLTPGSLEGEATLRRSRIVGVNGETLAPGQADTLGYSMAAGDVDGDGRLDLIIDEMLGDGAAPGTPLDVGNLIVATAARLWADAQPPLCPAEPIETCIAGPGKLAMQAGIDPADDRLRWRFGPGPMLDRSSLTVPSEDGEPALLCLWGGEGLLGQWALPPDPVCGSQACWRSRRRGLRFRDREAAHDGVRAVTLSVETGQPAWSSLRARGVRAAVPSGPLAAPVVVQWIGLGLCQETTFIDFLRNDAAGLRAVTAP